jgi:hypothetical protein
MEKYVITERWFPPYCEKFRKPEITYGRDLRSRISVLLTCMIKSFPDAKSRIDSFRKRLKTFDNRIETLTDALENFFSFELPARGFRCVSERCTFNLENKFGTVTFFSYKDEEYSVTLFVNKRLGFPILIERIGQDRN